MVEKRLEPMLAAAGFVLLALPALADHLDPRVAGPLNAMMQSAAMQCQQGSPQACQSVQRMRQVEMDLSRAEHACRQGHGQACQYFQNGAQQVVGAWQQQQQAGMIPGGLPQGGMPGGGHGYSPQQMTQDHQARMRQQQQQFQQQQQLQQQQQRQNDENHRRFMEQLRR